MRKEKRINLEREGKFDVKAHPYVLAYPHVDTPANVRAGVWQFMLDHASFTKEGHLKVFFIIESKDDLWRRVDARIRGEYRRINIEPMESHLKSGYGKVIARHLYEIRSGKKVPDEPRFKSYTEQAQEIDKNGSRIDKLLLWCYRKLRSRLFVERPPTENDKNILS